MYTSLLSRHMILLCSNHIFYVNRCIFSGFYVTVAHMKAEK